MPAASAPRDDPAPDAWVIRRPAPALRAWIDRYIGYRLVEPAPGIHLGLPSRHLTFVVGIGEPIDVAVQTDPRQAPQTYDAVVGGLQATSAVIAYDGRQEGVEIELTPLGSRALFGLPARALWNRSLELSDVVGDLGRELWERLQGPATWRERFAVCDDVLSRAARDDRTVTELGRCWDALVTTGGQVRVDDLAGRTGWSRQHLTRRFRDEFGLAPKRAARIVRFERAARLLRGPNPPSIAEVATRCGYHDQPHLHRDMVAMAGCTPARLLTAVTPDARRAPTG